MLSTIDVRLHLAAIALAEELHFGRAAKKLHIAASTLSKRIAQLELTLSIVLFLRTSKGVALTEDGKIYIREARASLRHMEKSPVNAASQSD